MTPVRNSSSARPLLTAKRKLLFAIILVVVLLLALEGGMRLAGFRPQSSSDRLERHFLADRDLGFAWEPNLEFRLTQVRGNPLIHTDSRGLRRTANPLAMPDQPAILCVGDSTTFCAEVDDKHTWPSELASLLAEKRPCQVVNAGIRGYSTVQSARMMDRLLPPLSIEGEGAGVRGRNGDLASGIGHREKRQGAGPTPDAQYPMPNPQEEGEKVRVAIYLYTENDLLENVNPIVYYPLQAPVMRWTDGRCVPVEVAEPAVPWGESFSTLAAKREESWRSRASDFIRQHSALGNFAISRLRGAGGAAAIEQHDGPDGCHGPVYPAHPGWPAEIAWAKAHHAEDVLVERIGWMNERCRASGAKLLVAEYPVGLREHTADLPDICRRAGAEFVDVSPGFPGPADQYMAIRVDGVIDGHLNANGTRAMARALAPRVLEIVSQ